MFFAYFFRQINCLFTFFPALRFGIATQIPQVPDTTAAAGGSGSQLSSNLSCSTPMKDLTSLTGDVYWLESNMIKHNGNVVKMNYSITPLERLVSGDKVKKNIVIIFLKVLKFVVIIFFLLPVYKNMYLQHGFLQRVISFDQWESAHD